MDAAGPKSIKVTATICYICAVSSKIIDIRYGYHNCDSDHASLLIFVLKVRFNLPEEWAGGQGAAGWILQENYKIIEACS
jgi:hypothetical protein